MTPTPSGTPTPELLDAADKFRKSILDRATIVDAGFAPAWHGWAIIDAFSAGAKFQEHIDRADRDRLREALKPFSDAADKADEAREESKRCGMGDLGESASTGLGIIFKHLYAARALYREMEGRS